MIIHFTCAFVLFTCSSTYHLFNSHSKKIMSFFIRFDYAGICLMIAGSSTSPIYYSFGCSDLEGWRKFYLAFIYIVCGFTLFILMIPKFDGDNYNAFRGILFIFTALSALFPIGHIVWIVDPKYIHHFHLLPWSLGGLAYVIGAFFYIT